MKDTTEIEIDRIDPPVPGAAEWVRRCSGATIWTGVILALLGILAIGAPLLAGATVAVMVGILLAIGGIGRVVLGWQARVWGQAILGLLVFACGLVMVLRPGVGLASLALVLAIYFVIHGVFEMVAAMRLRPVRGWGWLLMGGLVSVLLGLLIWVQWPVSGAWAVGILVGLNLLISGIALALLGSAGRSLARSVEGA